jgi:hypothetical protein
MPFALFFSKGSIFVVELCSGLKKLESASDLSIFPTSATWISLR